MKRKTLFIILGLLVLILAAVKGVELYIEKNYTDRPVPVGDIGTVYIEDIDLSLWGGNAKVTGINFPDSVNEAVRIEVDEVTVEGIGVLKLIFQRQFAADKVEVQGAAGELSMNRLAEEETMAANSVNDSIDEILKFDLRNLVMSISEASGPELQGIDLRDVSYRPGHGNYDFDIKSIHSQDPSSAIEIDSIALRPRYSKHAFGPANGIRTARVDFTFPSVKLNDFAMNRVFTDSLFLMSSIEVQNGDLLVMIDKRVPLDINKYAAMPHELLMTTGYDVTIDSVVAKDVDIRFEAINPNTLEIGFLDFDESYIRALNVNNTLAGIQTDNIMTMDVSSKFTKEGSLQAHFDFHLDREDFYFAWHGELGPMRFSTVNTFIIPVASMNIVEGQCHSLKFNVMSNVDSSNGTIDFQYEGLKVVALNPEKHKERGFVTGVANLFVVHGKNLKTDKKYVQGRIKYAREKHRGFEHYLYSSLERGIMYTILPPGLAKTIDKQMSKSPEEKEANRIKTEEKKANAADKKTTKEAKKAARREAREHRHKKKKDND